MKKNFHIFRNKDGHVICVVETALLGEIPVIGFEDLTAYRKFIDYCESKYNEFEGISKLHPTVRQQVLEILNKETTETDDRPETDGSSSS